MLWVIIGSAFITLVARASIERHRRVAQKPPLDDPRWNAESRKQIAGKRCVECGGKVIVAADGDACGTCGEVAHVKKCLVQHERSAHRVETNVPYR